MLSKKVAFFEGKLCGILKQLLDPSKCKSVATQRFGFPKKTVIVDDKTNTRTISSLTASDLIK